MTLTSKKQIADLMVAGCAIFLSTAYLIATFDIRSVDIVDPLGPRAYPALLGFVMLGCGVALAAKVVMRYLANMQVADDATDAFAGSQPLAVFAVGLWLLAYFIVFERLGFMLSSIVFIFGLTAFFNKGHWLINTAVAIVFPVLLELVLSYLLGRAPAPGILSF